MPKYDFAGWATKNNILCSDGRTIRENAFSSNDGQTVPLVWNHKHDSPDNILGYAYLENRPDGVYCFGSFNDTTRGQEAKRMVEHGDISSLSIFANHLNERDGNVYGGSIKEVSLVLAGANPGAYIESVLTHSEDGDDAAIIYSGGEGLTLMHSEISKKESQETMTKEEFKAMMDEYLSHNDDVEEPVVEEKEKEEEEDFDDVDFSTLSDEDLLDIYNNADLQTKNMLDAYVNAFGESKDKDKDEGDYEDYDEYEYDDEDELEVGDILEDEEGNQFIVGEDGEIYEFEGELEMKHNLFDNTSYDNTLAHADEESIFAQAKQIGSLKEAVENAGILMHDDTTTRQHPSNTDKYGINSRAGDTITWDPSILFPDFHKLDDSPYLYRMENSWVGKVMGGVKHTPFSRIKSMWADLTPDEVRAKGYVTGNRKIEEVFSVLKRTTVPTTIYKKQKLDRDDILDISDFDVVAWIKKEMRTMLDEEIARAILTGDGRLATSVDHINDQNIRPILTEDPLFTIPITIDHFASETVDGGTGELESIDDVDWASAARKLRKAIINAKKDYKGSGHLGLFISPEMHAAIKLLEDGFGRPLYANDADICSAYNVAYIVEVPYLFSALTYCKKVGNDAVFSSPLGIVVDLADYIVGADKGGQVSMFDDFDIDYNQQKYLIETRCCGALTKPHTAFTFWGRLNDAEDTTPIVQTVVTNTTDNPVNTKEVTG